MSREQAKPNLSTKTCSKLLSNLPAAKLERKVKKQVLSRIIKKIKRKEIISSYLLLSFVCMDDIHIDAFVNQFMKKLFSPLNRLHKNKDWRRKTLQNNKLYKVQVLFLLFLVADRVTTDLVSPSILQLRG